MVTPCVVTAPLAVVDDVCVRWAEGELVEEADFLRDLSTIKVTILYSVTINYTRMYVRMYSRVTLYNTGSVSFPALNNL